MFTVGASDGCVGRARRKKSEFRDRRPDVWAPSRGSGWPPSGRDSAALLVAVDRARKTCGKTERERTRGPVAAPDRPFQKGGRGVGGGAMNPPRKRFLPTARRARVGKRFPAFRDAPTGRRLRGRTRRFECFFGRNHGTPTTRRRLPGDRTSHKRVAGLLAADRTAPARLGFSNSGCI